MTVGGSRELLLEKLRTRQPLTARDELSLVFLLSVPAMMAQLSTIIMQYIDASMVGSLGAAASASIGLVSTTIWLFGGLVSSCSTGFYVQVAHCCGASQWGEARAVLRRSFSAAMQFSVALAVLGAAISPYLPRWLGGSPEILHDATLYFLVFSLTLPFAQLNSLCGGMLRSTGNILTPSILNVAMCVLDVLMNWLLIFPTRPCSFLGLEVTMPGAGLGVLGAVLGTSASFVVCSLLMTVICMKKFSKFGHEHSLVGERHTMRTALKIASPIAVEHAVMCGAQIASTVIVAPLGTIAIAANSFGIIVESLCYMPGYGIADAATTLVGQSLGAGRWKLARSFGRTTIGMGVAMMSLLAVVMYVYSPALMTLMTPDATVQQLTTEVLRIEAFAEPMYAASIVVYGVMVGAGRTLVPCCMNLGSIWLVRIPLAVVLAASMGLRGVWIAMACELCFRGAIFLFDMRRFAWKDVKLNTK